jgi:hypothetical protein
MEEEYFECFNCGADDLTVIYKCEICGTDKCLDCCKERNNLYFKEWLTDCPNKCYKCKRIGCGSCINVCYSCDDLGEKDFQCDDCRQLGKVNCQYHTWYICNKHSPNECPECNANRNFAARYS